MEEFLNFVGEQTENAEVAGNAERAAAFREVRAWLLGNMAPPTAPAVEGRTAVSIPEAARLAHLSPVTLYRAVDRGELPAETVGGGDKQRRRMIQVSALSTWLEVHRGRQRINVSED